ncbi:MAG: 3-oxoacid CoA-transferase subunit A [Candidatus Latescibacteria bacterium]|nr:3-oxoacid CoA-transferase subunit A [Candidatus Latescibacterota bacterium]
MSGQYAHIMTADEAVALIEPEQTVMIGGFVTVGSPHTLIDALVRRGTRPIRLIVTDNGFEDRGIGRLIVNRQVSQEFVSHIGLCPETGRQMAAGEMDVTLVPQGTLIEQIRASGAGLGGVLTPTGLGTAVEQGKPKIQVDGREYLLEKPLRADVALIRAYRADRQGNLVYRRVMRNFNPTMATAARLTIAEVDEVVEVGDLDPEHVETPFVYVDILVGCVIR